MRSRANKILSRAGYAWSGVAALVFAGHALAGAVLDSWQWRSPLPQGNPLLGLAAGEGKFVAAGDHGTILVSFDTVHWQPAVVGMTGRFNGVVHHDGQFVAVGNGIWTSTNGVDWSERNSAHLSAVAWADGGYVTVGWQGTILTSADGITWSNRISGTTEQLNAITHANGMFVAVGGYYTNSALLTSTDALNWTNRTFSSDILTGVACGNAMFVAVGFNFYGSPAVSITSPDGANWTRNPVSKAWLYAGVCFDQGRFVLAGTDGVYTSTNGTDWIMPYSEFPNSLHGVTPGSGGFIAVGNAGAIVTSPDGTQWRRQTVGTWHSISDVAEGNSKLVAVGSRGAKSTSEDGANWTHRAWGQTSC